jgi:GH24 family phage-related lysozyme (muramidase)
MPASNSLAISKFLGKTRYDHYVQELTGYGTIGGTQLTAAQRKQAFVIRNNKIKFEKFVDTFLNKKSATIKTNGPGRTPGPKSGAIVKSPGGSVQKYMQTQQQKFADGAEDQNLSDILNKIDEILNSLREEQKTKTAGAEFDRKKKEKEKRDLLKSKLKKRFEGLKKAAEKVLAPVKNILQKIIDFILTIFVGRFLYKLLEWWGDPANKDKVRSIIRFFGDHWPKLLALYITFGTSFGKFALGLTRAVMRGGIKLAAAIARLLAAKKVRGAMGAARFLGGGKGKLLANIAGTALTLGGTYALTQGLKGDDKEQKAPGYSGGGFVIPKFFGGGFNLGNMFGGIGNFFNGLVSGEKGVDKVPAMLSDGEFVMSRGAVEKYGVDTLEAMNAAGGGTNRPKMVSGTAFAAGGGFIGKAADHLKHDEALSSLTKGANDFIKPGGTSAVTAKSWNIVKPQTPVHSYVDSVGQATIGWGSTFYDSILNGKKPVKPGDTITKSQADQILSTNIMNLAKSYSQKIPMWNKMSDDQKAGVLLVGYNAPYGPIGAYQKLTAALQSGNMVSAAENVKRGGPSAARLSIEKQLILNGPKDLSKASKEEDTQQNQSNIFQRIQSGVSSVMSGIMKPKAEKPIKEKYGKGGYAPRASEFTSAKPKIGNNITPLPRRKANVTSLDGMNMGGGGYSMPSGPGGKNVPSFSATAPGNDRSNKMKTLGIM